MTRWKASGIHLTISILAGLVAFCLLYFIYYPQPYFAVAGADQLVLMLLGIDVILGPLLTLLVFKSGKKSLKFDLSTIAVIQIAALVYGLHIMWAARPVFIVGAVDRFNIVFADDLDAKDLAEAKYPEFSSIPRFGPKLVGVKQPENPDEQFALAESGMAGKDIERLPKYYVPYELGSAAFAQRAKPLTELRSKSPEAEALISAWLKGRGAVESYIYLPIAGGRVDGAVIMDKQTGGPVDILRIDAW